MCVGGKGRQSIVWGNEGLCYTVWLALAVHVSCRDWYTRHMLFFMVSRLQSTLAVQQTVIHDRGTFGEMISKIMHRFCVYILEITSIIKIQLAFVFIVMNDFSLPVPLLRRAITHAVLVQKLPNGWLATRVIAVSLVMFEEAVFFSHRWTKQSQACKLKHILRISRSFEPALCCANSVLPIICTRE